MDRLSVAVLLIGVSFSTAAFGQTATPTPAPTATPPVLLDSVGSVHGGDSWVTVRAAMSVVSVRSGNGWTTVRGQR